MSYDKVVFKQGEKVVVEWSRNEFVVAMVCAFLAACCSGLSVFGLLMWLFS